MARYLTELIGTFFLVLVIWLSVASGSSLAPLAIGLALMVSVYMGGPVSGGHYNPAVSFGLLLHGKLSGPDFGLYVVAQLAGGLLAALSGQFLVGGAVAPALAEQVGVPQAALAEALFTFLLVLVIFNVAVSARTEGNSYFGAAIGMTVTVGAFAVGGISGGSFNPAVAIGTTAIAKGLGATGGSWWLIYLVVPLAAAGLANVVFRLQEATVAEE